MSNSSAFVQLTEAEVRTLRDCVYGHPSSDHNWEMCRENWMRPDSVEWLVSKVKKGPA